MLRVRILPRVFGKWVFAGFNGEVCPKRVLDVRARRGHDRVYLMTTTPNPMDVQYPVAFFQARKQHVLEELSRHMVALSWIDALIDPVGNPTTIESRRPMTHVKTGFLLGVMNHRSLRGWIQVSNIAFTVASPWRPATRLQLKFT